jgi:hypothetical protein
MDGPAAVCVGPVTAVNNGEDGYRPPVHDWRQPTPPR